MYLDLNKRIKLNEYILLKNEAVETNHFFVISFGKPSSY